jgi:hypothetical protein
MTGTELFSEARHLWWFGGVILTVVSDTDGSIATAQIREKNQREL